MRLVRSTFLPLVGLLLCSLPAHAGGTAEELFRQGRKAIEAGDFKTACEKFEESQKLEPAPGTLLNLADCEERAGRVVLASEHYRFAASGFGKTDPRRAFALDKANAMFQRITKVTFKADPSLPEGAIVHVGDVVLRKFGEELPFDPGPLTLTVEAKGREPKTTRIELEPGKKVEVNVEPGPEAKPGSPERIFIHDDPKNPPKPEPPHTQRTLGIIGMVAGGVTLAAGTAFGIYALDRGAVYGSHCNRTTNACDSEGVDAANSVSWLAPVSTIAIIAGGAIATAGVVLYFTAPKHSSTTVSLAPSLGGLHLQGTF